MTELIALITGMLGDKLPVATVLKLAPVLVPIVADLADGDARLSAAHRLTLQEAIEDIKGGAL